MFSPGILFGALAVFAPMTCAFGNGPAQDWRDIRHSLSGVQTQIVWQDTTLFKKEDCSGLTQCEEVFLFDEGRVRSHQDGITQGITCLLWRR